jgi:hypothetical protein
MPGLGRPHRCPMVVRALPYRQARAALMTWAEVGQVVSPERICGYWQDKREGVVAQHA